MQKFQEQDSSVVFVNLIPAASRQKLRGGFNIFGQVNVHSPHQPPRAVHLVTQQVGELRHEFHHIVLRPDQEPLTPAVKRFTHKRDLQGRWFIRGQEDCRTQKKRRRTTPSFVSTMFMHWQPTSPSQNFNKKNLNYFTTPETGTWYGGPGFTSELGFRTPVRGWSWGFGVVFFSLSVLCSSLVIFCEFCQFLVFFFGYFWSV